MSPLLFRELLCYILYSKGSLIIKNYLGNLLTCYLSQKFPIIKFGAPKGLLSQAAHFYDNEILGYQAQSYRGKSSKKEWWYVAASKNCPDTGRRGPSTISLKNLC